MLKTGENTTLISHYLAHCSFFAILKGKKRKKFKPILQADPYEREKTEATRIQ